MHGWRSQVAQDGAEWSIGHRCRPSRHTHNNNNNPAEHRTPNSIRLAPWTNNNGRGRGRGKSNDHGCATTTATCNNEWTGRTNEQTDSIQNIIILLHFYYYVSPRMRFCGREEPIDFAVNKNERNGKSISGWRGPIFFLQQHQKTYFYSCAEIRYEHLML